MDEPRTEPISHPSPAEANIVPPAPARPAERLASLDVFRGITIAGMILVNNPGMWGRDHVYAPLLHAEWHGWTPTDQVFPSFLFIVGVALTFSFDKRLAAGFSRLRLFEQVLRRTFILFLLGLILQGLPRWRLIAPYVLGVVGLVLLFWDEPPLGWPALRFARFRKLLAWAVLAAAVAFFVIDFGTFAEGRPLLRVPGVLQRIAMCYLAASVIVLCSGVGGRVLWTAALLLGYWAIVAWGVPPAVNPTLLAARPEGLLHDYIDVRILGGHIYSERPDPEGILSTVPAITTTLLGVLAGGWLRSRLGSRDKAFGLFLAGCLALAAGLWMHQALPINKKIWTSSYVLFTAGVSLHGLWVCYYLVDVVGLRRWAWPFMVFGTNAITVFFASGILGRLLFFVWKLPSDDGRTLLHGVGVGKVLSAWAHQLLSPSWTTTALGANPVAVKTWLYQTLFASWAGPKPSSLLFAISYVLLWLLLMTPLYRRRVFIKV